MSRIHRQQYNVRVHKHSRPCQNGVLAFNGSQSTSASVTSGVAWLARDCSFHFLCNVFCAVMTYAGCFNDGYTTLGPASGRKRRPAPRHAAHWPDLTSACMKRCIQPVSDVHKMRAVASQIVLPPASSLIAVKAWQELAGWPCRSACIAYATDAGTAWK